MTDFEADPAMSPPIQMAIRVGNATAVLLAAVIGD